MVVNHPVMMATPEPVLPFCSASALHAAQPCVLSAQTHQQSNKAQRMIEMRAKLITAGLLGAAVTLPIDHAKTDQLGHASWYSLPANTTANGEQMDPTELTAAHR